MEKVDLNKGYWNPQRKLRVAKHFSEIISLESRIKMLTSAFFCKRRKFISLQISLEFAFKYRKLTIFTKIFKVHGKW